MKNELLIALILGIGFRPGICNGQTNLQQSNDSLRDSQLPVYVETWAGDDIDKDRIPPLIFTPIEIDLTKCNILSNTIPESRAAMNPEKQYIVYKIMTPAASQIAYKYELSVTNCAIWPKDGTFTILEDLEHEFPVTTPLLVGDDLVGTVLIGNSPSTDRAIVSCEDVNGDMKSHILSVKKICSAQTDHPYTLHPCVGGCQSFDAYFQERKTYYIICTSSDKFACPLQASCIECDTSKHYYTLPKAVANSLLIWGDKEIIEEGSFAYGIFDFSYPQLENANIVINANISGYARIYPYDLSDPKKRRDEMIGVAFEPNVPATLPLKGEWKCDGIQLIFWHNKKSAGNVQVSASSLELTRFEQDSISTPIGR